MAAALDDDDDDAWSDAEAADEEPKVPCITDPSRVFASAADALAHDAARGFDLRAITRDARVDFYGAVRIVNFARTRRPSGNLARWF